MNVYKNYIASFLIGSACLVNAPSNAMMNETESTSISSTATVSLREIMVKNFPEFEEGTISWVEKRIEKQSFPQELIPSIVSTMSELSRVDSKDPKGLRPLNALQVLHYINAIVMN